MQKIWIKAADGTRYDGRSIVKEGYRIINPTADQLEKAGYELRELTPPPPTLAEVKAAKLAEIDAYDTSGAVNSFTLDGQAVWLDKATRVGLMNSLNCEKGAGRTVTTLWLGTMPVTLDVERAMGLLALVELYALECFGVTARHKAVVEAMESAEAVKSYDHTAGYPDRPVINTKTDGDE